MLGGMTNPVEALSPLRPAGQTPARAEARPASGQERARPERARAAQAQQALAEGLGQNLDVLA
jgi:hypothetical protein